MSLPSPRGGRWHCVLADPAGEPGRLALASDPSVVAAPGSGALVKQSRTGWVQRLSDGKGAYFAKTYVYPTARDRRRGWLRNTWLAPSRARREADALAWLRAHGFGAPRLVLVAELRRFGVLHAAVIVTEAVDGRRLDEVLPGLAAGARDDLLRGLREFVRALHREGFRDRNLDLRNVLVVEGEGGPGFFKIDSPRFRLRAAGGGDDRLAREDWRRLGASLAELGMRWPG